MFKKKYLSILFLTFAIGCSQGSAVNSTVGLKMINDAATNFSKVTSFTFVSKEVYEDEYFYSDKSTNNFTIDTITELDLDNFYFRYKGVNSNPQTTVERIFFIKDDTLYKLCIHADGSKRMSKHTNYDTKSYSKSFLEKADCYNVLFKDESELKKSYFGLAESYIDKEYFDSANISYFSSSENDLNVKVNIFEKLDKQDNKMGIDYKLEYNYKNNLFYESSENLILKKTDNNVLTIKNTINFISEKVSHYIPDYSDYELVENAESSEIIDTFSN